MTFVGSQAPTFKLQDEQTYWRELPVLLKPKPLLLVFYPGDFTLVCTKQLCAYQKSFGAFAQIGIGLVGISRAVFIVSREGKIAYRQVELPRLTHRKPAELLSEILELKKRSRPPWARPTLIRVNKFYRGALHSPDRIRT